MNRYKNYGEHRAVRAFGGGGTRAEGTEGNTDTVAMSQYDDHSKYTHSQSKQTWATGHR